MSQSEFSLALGVTQGTVSRWENGHASPRYFAEAIRALANGKTSGKSDRLLERIRSILEKTGR